MKHKNLTAEVVIAAAAVIESVLNKNKIHFLDLIWVFKKSQISFFKMSWAETSWACAQNFEMIMLSQAKDSKLRNDQSEPS